jgi:tRNA(fMet)-specific endonuclease VapC
MSFVIDTDICSAFMRGDGKTFNKFMQHSGRLFVSAVTVAELYAWVTRKKTAGHRLRTLRDMLSDMKVLNLDLKLAEFTGTLRATLLDEGKSVPDLDFFIATTALFHDFTLVTHNVADYQQIPNLRIQDWLA